MKRRVAVVIIAAAAVVISLGMYGFFHRRPAELRACYAELFGFYDSGVVKPAPAVMFPLDRAGEALAAVRDRHIDGRAVLRLRAG